MSTASEAPTPATPAAPAAPTGATGATEGRGIRRAVLTLLAVDGVLCAAVTALLLPAYVGPVPFPASALIGGLVNAVLVWAGLYWTTSLRLAALPLWTWLVTVAVMALGGPGDDLIFGGRGVMAFGVLMMIMLGVAPPLWLLWRRRRSTAEASESGEQARQIRNG